MASENKNSFGDLLQNPRGLALKRLVWQILENKYAPYDDLMNRAAFFLVTEGDINLFSKMIADVYEVGYLKAVADYKEQLSKLGIQVNVGQKNLGDNR